MPKYTIDIHREDSQVSPVGVVICRYCSSIVIIVGPVDSDGIFAPMVCEQEGANSYPCGGQMALVNDKHTRDLLDDLAANLQNTDS